MLNVYRAPDGRVAAIEVGDYDTPGRTPVFIPWDAILYVRPYYGKAQLYLRAEGIVRADCGYAEFKAAIAPAAMTEGVPQ